MVIISIESIFDRNFNRVVIEVFVREEVLGYDFVNERFLLLTAGGKFATKKGSYKILFHLNGADEENRTPVVSLEG